MVKIERITIGSIDDLTSGEIPEEIGHTTIRENVVFGDISIKLPNEKRVIKATNLPGHGATSRRQFLEFVENLLKKNGWYLAEAEYTAHRRGFFYNKHKLNGRIYVERKA